jgi:hypothetical protein
MPIRWQRLRPQPLQTEPLTASRNLPFMARSLAGGLLAIVPSEPFLSKAYRHLNGTDRNVTARSLRESGILYRSAINPCGIFSLASLTLSGGYRDSLGAALQQLTAERDAWRFDKNMKKPSEAIRHRNADGECSRYARSSIQSKGHEPANGDGNDQSVKEIDAVGHVGQKVKEAVF